MLASKNIRWWKHWPDGEWMEKFEVENVATLRCVNRVRNCVCVNVCMCLAAFLSFHHNEKGFLYWNCFQPHCRSIEQVHSKKYFISNSGFCLSHNKICWGLSLARVTCKIYWDVIYIFDWETVSTGGSSSVLFFRCRWFLVLRQDTAHVLRAPRWWSNSTCSAPKLCDKLARCSVACGLCFCQGYKLGDLKKAGNRNEQFATQFEIIFFFKNVSQ